MHTGNGPSPGMTGLLEVDRRVQPERRAATRNAPRNAFFRGLGLGLLLSAALWITIISAVLMLF